MHKLIKNITDNLFFNSKDYGILFLRMVPSFYLFYNHGLSKLANGVSSWQWLGKAVMPLVGIDFGHTFFGFLAACSEGILSIFVIIGFWTRLSSFFISITMFFAGLYHFVDGESAESAFIYLSIYIVIIILGSGRYSMDNYFNRNN